MSDMPKTLFQLAGAEPAPTPLSQGALLLIDCQEEYRSGPLALPRVEPALSEAQALLARARAAGRPVIHVRHVGGPGGPFDPDAPRGQIAQAVAPLDGEPVILKRKPNAFADTVLMEELQAHGIETLIVAGFMTHMCVSSTVRSALDHGIGATVVASACATRALPDRKGGAVPAETLHQATLAALSDRFAAIAETAADVPD
jgi:nicotinamidase-related amidase